MALRVLLADESSTIKKVIQLSLQDFGVEVKSVTVGLDVLSVTKSFRPDVVLADVLLAKRSGYEVCHDLKSDQETASIPVVLMWSGFMEIDEQKARLCGADRRLEKPFDAATLRQIVQELISKTQSHPASSYMQFPNLPPFEEPVQKAKPPASSTPEIAIPSGLPKIPTEIPIQVSASDDSNELVIDDTEESADEWVQQPIANKTAAHPTIEIPIMKQHEPEPVALKEDEFTEYPLTQAKPTAEPATKPITQRPLHERVVTSPHVVAPPPVAAAPQPAAVSEEIVREEVQKWLAKHMPDIAERLIRDEINRLLQESEKTIQSP